MSGFRVFAAATLLAVATTAGADGGAVVAQAESDALVVTVFVAPVPLRAGPADVSVLVQSAGDGNSILDAEVSVLLSREGGVVARAYADHAQATNQLLYAARVEVPAPGAWRLDVAVERGEERVTVGAALKAAPGLAAPVRFWPWVLLPIVVAGSFLVHQWLSDS